MPDVAKSAVDNDLSASFAVQPADFANAFADCHDGLLSLLAFSAYGLVP
jgi:hypothetical protein